MEISMVLNFHLVLASPTTVHFLQHAKAYAMLVMKSNINEEYTVNSWGNTQCV